MLVTGRTQVPVTRPSPWHYGLIVNLPEGVSTLFPQSERSARGSVLPVDLGEASERAFPTGAVLLALKSTLLGAEEPHCSVGAPHQDLRGEEDLRSSRAAAPWLPSSGPNSCRSPESHRRRPSTGRSPPPRAAAV